MTRRQTTLHLVALDDRLAPAVAVYSHGTLFVTAATGELITIDLNASNVPGHFRVNASVPPAPGALIFDSAADRPVRNLVVNGNAAVAYGLVFGPGISLNNLAVSGGTSAVGPATAVALGADTRISGNFTFSGNPAGGDDAIFVGGATRVSGNVSLNLRGGNNLVDIGGGLIGGNVVVAAGAGNDTVNVAGVGALTIGGNVMVSLGDGANSVTGLAANPIAVGRNLIYIGGTGDDRINLMTTPLRVGGSAYVDLRTVTGVVILPADFWHSTDLVVGRDFVARGGLGVKLYGPNQIAGNVTAISNPTGGSFFGIGDAATLLFNTAASTVGGSVRFIGGARDDGVILDHLAVGRGVSLDLRGGTNANVDIGTTQNATVQIGGSLAIGSGATASAFNIMRTQVAGGLAVKTFGGDDRTWIDDSDIGGAAVFDLGAGSDTVRVDIADTDPNGNALPLRSRFQSSLIVIAGDGNDGVSLGSIFSGTGVNIGGPVRLFGGNGTDDLTLNAGNIYLQIRSEDFETGNSF